MTDQKLVEKAKAFAARVHAGQKQNDIEESPRWPHFEEVAQLVTDSGGSANEIAAAWLHDAVEDTLTTLEDLRKEFGDQIADMVDGLTDPAGYELLPVAERKAKQAERILAKSPSVKRVKIADQSSNVKAVGTKVFLDMQGERAVAYLNGAKAIVEGCKGVSPYLEKIFQERYEIALRKLTRGESIKVSTSYQTPS